MTLSTRWPVSATWSCFLCWPSFAPAVCQWDRVAESWPNPDRPVPSRRKRGGQSAGAADFNLGGWARDPAAHTDVRLRLAIALEPRTVWGHTSRQHLGEAAWRWYVVRALCAAKGRCET